MKIENENKKNEAKGKALEALEKAENKAEGVLQAVEILNEANYEELIEEIKEQAEQAKEDKEYAKSLNLRVLSREERTFYEKFKNIKQSLTAAQEDIIPTSIIDVTLEDVKKESGIMDLISFTPANVKKWLTGDRLGTAVWGKLTEEIKGKITAEVKGLNIELAKLSAYLIIPKAISDLALPFVDKFFRAVLKEVMTDGMEEGFLIGSGEESPIGIYKKITEVNEDGTHKDKEVGNTIINFRPKTLAPVKKTLSNDGKRKYDKIYLICHPNDQADYVDPAILDYEGKLISSYKNLEVLPSTNNPLGKAAFILPKKYTMGFSGFKLEEFKETLALDDADLIVAKVYANGRANDDNCAYIFDVTKLEEYVPTVKIIDEEEI